MLKPALDSGIGNPQYDFKTSPKNENLEIPVAWRIKRRLTFTFLETYETTNVIKCKTGCKAPIGKRDELLQRRRTNSWREERNLIRNKIKKSKIYVCGNIRYYLVQRREEQIVAEEKEN